MLNKYLQKWYEGCAMNSSLNEKHINILHVGKPQTL